MLRRLGGAAAALAARPARAQPPTGTLRLALLSQWTVNQHRASGGGVEPVLLDALNRGVVDRTVFAWQDGVIPRSALVPKPIRVLPEPEAAILGGRGRFDLVAVRPPTGQAAWTAVDVALSPGGPDEVAVLEIGGERNTVAQVLETLLVVEGARLSLRPLAPVALVPGSGVPVVRLPFGRPVTLPDAAARFADVAGVGVLVVRSPVETVRGGGLTPSGPADASPLGGGDWREGDRVLLRIAAGVLARGPAPLVLAWKDRTLMPDPDGEFPRRSALPFPLIR